MTAYAAGPPAPEDAYQAILGADHCGISSDMTGSILLAANPELSAACRFASMKLEQQAMVAIPLSYLAGPDGAGTMDEAQRARQAETARYSGLAEAYASRTEMSDSRFLAENPEVMKAGRFTKTEGNVSLQQKTDTIQCFGVAEFLAAESGTASVDHKLWMPAYLGRVHGR